MSFSAIKLTEIIGFNNSDDLFTNEKCLGNGKQTDTINYRWICKCDMTIRRIIANQILYNGDYLWIFNFYGLTKLYKILTNNFKRFIKNPEIDEERKKKLTSSYKKLKYNIPKSDFFQIEIVATNDPLYYEKRKQRMYQEQEFILREHLQRFYNKPIVHCDDIMEIRKYDIELEVYRNLSCCDIIHDDGIKLDLPKHILQLKDGKIVTYPVIYTDCRRDIYNENIEEIDCVSSC